MIINRIDKYSSIWSLPEPVNRSPPHPRRRCAAARNTGRSPPPAVPFDNACRRGVRVGGKLRYNNIYNINIRCIEIVL